MAILARQRVNPDLAKLIGRSQVLAVASTADGQVVATTDSLWFPTSDGWQRQPWHLISHGGWEGAERRLHWRDRDQTKHSLHLTDVGRLPDVFNERVTDSIVVQRTVNLASFGSAVISARRDLGRADTTLEWRVEPAPGTSAEAANADRLVAAELARLRAEYDVG
jgi:hypothetical protein